MTDTFNLVREPWIPVLDARGRVTHLGLADVVRRADELTRVTGDVPTQAVALQRLILAVLHRALHGPQSLDEWRACNQRWPEVVDRVEQYLGTFEQRWDLLHPIQPFFQVADLSTSKGEVSSLKKIVADAERLPYLSMRQGRGLTSLTPAEAARWLVHCHAFDVSGIKSGDRRDPRVKHGKGYGIGLGWTGQIGTVMARGATVKETLLRT